MLRVDCRHAPIARGRDADGNQTAFDVSRRRLEPAVDGAECRVGGGVNSEDCLKLVADLVETLLRDIERLDVATAADIGLATLCQRIRSEVISRDSVIVGRSEVVAWTRA